MAVIDLESLQQKMFEIKMEQDKTKREIEFLIKKYEQLTEDYELAETMYMYKYNRKERINEFLKGDTP